MSERETIMYKLRKKILYANDVGNKFFLDSHRVGCFVNKLYYCLLVTIDTI